MFFTFFVSNDLDILYINYEIMTVAWNENMGVEIYINLSLVFFLLLNALG